jgi:hypothetical protein
MASPRYRLLEPIRQYALAHFQSHSDAALVRRGHAAFFLELAERAEPELFGPDQRNWFHRLERELDNIRAALDWSGAEPERLDVGLRLASALWWWWWWFWDTRGHLREASDRLVALLARSNKSVSTRVRAKALFACGYLMNLQGERETAARLLNESVELWRKLGAQKDLAWALWALGISGWLSEPATAVAPAEESLARFRAVSNLA